MTTPNTIIETIARALCAAQGCLTTENELDRAKDEAESAILALEDAGYAIVPKDAQDALSGAVHIVRTMAGEGEWLRRNVWMNWAQSEGDFKMWAEHWLRMYESVSAIADDLDRTILEVGDV